VKITVQGHEAYAYTGGKALDAALPCLVMVHGALHDHSVWTLLARWFGHHGHSVLALDLPGHGRSAGPPLTTVETTADWLLAVMDAAGVAQAAVAGHSMGALVGLEAAARAPDRITRLVMLGAAYPMKVSDALFTAAREQPLHAIRMVNNFSISTTAAKPSHPGPGAWLHGGNQVLMERNVAQARRSLGIDLFTHDFQVCDRYAGGLQAAALVRCPVHFILGARDQMASPRASRELGTALKARVVTLPGVGHHLMAEAPDAVLAAMRAALA
jgi:pimeloyl-ACP methyl ester carboxylesterase